jgi:enoyl-CoA hydratase/carnithine racemase
MLNDREDAMEEPVLLRLADGIATITLNRPKVLNALDGAMVDGLAAALERIEANPELRVVVLEGAGAGFMAGGDIRAFQAVMDRSPDEKPSSASFTASTRSSSCSGDCPSRSSPACTARWRARG